MMTLTELEAMLTRSLTTVKPRLEIGLAKVGTHTQTLAAHYIGHYMPGWAPLSPVTIADKERKGFSVPDPRLRTGADRDSIAVEMEALEVVVGSPRKIFLYQEMGTKHIPPRPVLSLAMTNTLPEAGDIFGEIAVGLLTGKK